MKPATPPTSEARAESRAQPPLAERMRPRTLEEFIGQTHILGPGRLLRRAIQADRLTSVIFSGPPGTGKTTLARIIANSTRAQFLAMNAVLAGIKDIREAIDSALSTRKASGRATVLFIDEVHRFNKAQQDALLPHVENGTFILIGATTENPYFEVNKALVSRSRIFQMRALEESDILQALRLALGDSERGYGAWRVECEAGALEHLVRMAQGDARSALNALELAVETTAPNAAGVRRLTLSVAEESIQRKAVLYDKDGDAHYDTISAFIKSVRGSDPDAALYWLAKMVEAGEDPRFLFRRMVILASEDVGLADPQALRVVMSAAQAFDYVGLPEGQFHLAEACLYLATAPKSNSALAFFDALKTVREEKIDSVPDAIKDKSRDGDLGHGQNYLYPHAFRDHWVAQQYLPESLRGRVFYEPGREGYEAGLRDTVLRRREAQLASAAADSDSDSDASAIPAPKAGRSPWLDRAAGVGSDVIRQLREDICAAAELRRESLVFDLGGHHGFLAWEASRRCVEGGVWLRCDDEPEKRELEGWLNKVDLLSRPQLWVSPLAALPKSFQSLSDAPRFDVILGLKVEPPGLEWIEALRNSVGPEARWVLAFNRERHHIDWEAALAKASPAFRNRVVSLDAEYASRLAPESLGRQWERRWAEVAGWKLECVEKTYVETRRLAPRPAREGLALAAEKPLSRWAALRQGLTGEEWETLLGLVTEYFAEATRNFPVTYEILVARRAD